MIRFIVHSFVTRVAYAVRGYGMVAFTTTGAFGKGNQHTNPKLFKLHWLFFVIFSLYHFV